jgi:hypothetical protein
MALGKMFLEGISELAGFAGEAQRGEVCEADCPGGAAAVGGRLSARVG